MYIYIYIYVYIYICMYIHVFIYNYIYMYIYKFIHSYMHAYMHTYIHACMHAYIHIYIIFIHWFIYIFMCIYTYIRMRACMCVLCVLCVYMIDHNRWIIIGVSPMIWECRRFLFGCLHPETTCDKLKGSRWHGLDMLRSTGVLRSIRHWQVVVKGVAASQISCPHSSKKNVQLDSRVSVVNIYRNIPKNEAYSCLFILCSMIKKHGFKRKFP